MSKGSPGDFYWDLIVVKDCLQKAYAAGQRIQDTNEDQFQFVEWTYNATVRLYQAFASFLEDYNTSRSVIGDDHPQTM